MSDRDTAADGGDTRQKLREAVLADHPRLGPDDPFTFACRPGISCFNRCCSDVNIFLSPYDVLRLKSRLGITSGEFLERYTLVPVQKAMRTPVVLLRMNEDDHRKCPFVTEAGCSVYADRPWPCRMYPVGLAAQRDTADGWRGEHFYFLLRERGCKGFEESRDWTVREWLADQGVDPYEEWGDAWKELTLHEFFDMGGELAPEKLEMLFTACYDLDRFRRFVFESTLLARFDVDEDLVEEMRDDDEALLRFAFLWLRFSLFGEPTVRPHPEAVEAIKGRTTRAAASGGAVAVIGEGAR